MRRFEIKLARADVATYQQLLLEDWSESSLHAALKLTRGILERAGLLLAQPELDARRKVKSRAKKYPIPTTASPALGFFLSRINESLPDVVKTAPPSRRSEHKIALGQQTGHCITIVLLRHILAEDDVELFGDTGFFRDLQTLIFNLACLFLLPVLQKERMEYETNQLASALHVFPQMEWQDEPSQQYHLLSLLFDAIGNRQAANAMAHNASRLTTPSEHEFLTLQQVVLFGLLSDERFEEAESFVLGLQRSVPRPFLAEVRELVRLTYRMWQERGQPPLE